MDIDKLEAGRELDALVAERVMEIDLAAVRDEVGWYKHPDGYTRREPPCLPYSTEIAAAWEVVEKLGAVPLAICRAALKAKGGNYILAVPRMKAVSCR